MISAVPLTWWALFNGLVLVLLALDLGVFHRQNREVGIKESLAWSAVWVSLALGVNGFVVHTMGPEAGMQFVTGYLIEKSLSVDNLFVFLILFRHFRVPAAYQHRILFWGILGALVMRAAMIFAGVALLQQFEWISYLFGAVLVWTAWKLIGQEAVFEPEKSAAFQWLSRHLRVSDSLGEGKFFVRQQGRWLATRMLLVLVLVEFTDLVFAVDSIPAVLGITTHPFLVYPSNVMAVLGLRSLYFALAAGMGRLRYLNVGLAMVLSFVGAKMLLAQLVGVPTLTSLAVVAFILTATVVASLKASPDGR
ncbi:TerC family protein [bacterium]|nr:TerC family protein [bacterium]